MKRVMRKIFVSVLALAMIVGIIGVQKISVSAADNKYSHVDIQTEGVKYDVLTTYGETESKTVTYDKIVAIKKVTVVFDKNDPSKNVELQHSRDDNSEFGYVVDSNKVEYKDNVYKTKHGISWEGLRISSDFEEILVEAELTQKADETNTRECVIHIDGAEANAKNECKGSGDTLGLDIKLTGSERIENKVNVTVTVVYMRENYIDDKLVSEGSPSICGGEDFEAYVSYTITDADKNDLIEKYKDKATYGYTDASVEFSSEDGKVTGSDDRITITYILKIKSYTTEVTVTHNYYTYDEFTKVTTPDATTSSAFTATIGLEYTLEAQNREGYSENANKVYTVVEGENKVVFDYTKTVNSEPEKEKPIVPDYIPVVPIEEKKEEVVEIIEEEVPEAPVEEPVEEEEEVVEEIEVEIPEIPEALPKTGTASAELFFGLGSFFMTIGAAFVLFARRKN